MEAFDPMRRALACAGYHRQDDFARILLMAAPRLRTAGSAAVFSTRLTPAIADAAIALSRMGARMRYTLVTAEARNRASCWICCASAGWRRCMSAPDYSTPERRIFA